MRETNGNFDTCNSCKRLVPSRLHELHESKFPLVSRIEFIRSKLSNFSAHVYGVIGRGLLGPMVVCGGPAGASGPMLSPICDIRFSISGRLDCPIGSSRSDRGEGGGGEVGEGRRMFCRQLPLPMTLGRGQMHDKANAEAQRSC